MSAGLIQQAALDAALRDQAADGRRLGEILVARKLVTDTQVTQLLSHQLALPWVSLAKITPDPLLIALIPREIAERHHIVPIYLRRVKTQSTLYVATDDPTHEGALRDCAKASRMEVRPMVAASHDVRNALDAWYGTGAHPSSAAAASPPAGAMRVAASVAPPPDRKTAIAKPAAIPPSRVPRVEALEIDDDDVMPHVSTPPGEQTRPVVLVVGGRSSFARKCVQAATALQADVDRVALEKSVIRARELVPFAIVVPEDVYSFDRYGLTKLSFEVDALLVIWSDDLEPEYLEPLLDTALKRRKPRT